MNIAQKKDRIDELEVEIEKLKAARAKMMTQQLISHDELKAEYESSASLVADALIAGDPEKARALQKNLENKATDDAGLAGRIKAANIGIDERSAERQRLLDTIRSDQRSKADKLVETDLPRIESKAVSALVDYTAITWVRTGIRPPLENCVALLQRADPIAFKSGVSDVRDKFVQRMETL